MTVETLRETQDVTQQAAEAEMVEDVLSQVTGGANAADYIVHGTSGAFLGGVGGVAIGAAVGGAVGKEKGVKKGMEIGAPVGVVVGAAGLAAAAKAFR